MQRVCCAYGTALAAGEGEAEEGMGNLWMHARHCLHDLHGMGSYNMSSMPNKHDQHSQQAPDFHNSCTIQDAAPCAIQACDAATVPTSFWHRNEAHAGHWGHVLMQGEQPGHAVKVTASHTVCGGRPRWGRWRRHNNRVWHGGTMNYQKGQRGGELGSTNHLNLQDARG